MLGGIDMCETIEQLKEYKNETVITNKNRQFITELMEIGVMSINVSFEKGKSTAKLNEQYAWLIDEKKPKINRISLFFEAVGKIFI